jgi:glyoxylase-like metal-dependent hydrolase (beta-lactamase superfamily II)
VDVQEIAPGLWRWTALHPEWTPEIETEDGWAQEVNCVYFETPDAVVVIDPLVPPEDPERFWQALDGDVSRAARPVHVLLTIHWHARSSRAIAERYPGTRVWAHEPARELVEERTVCTDFFRAGDTVPGGVVALDAHRAWEALFWIPDHRTLVAGDVLCGTGDGVRVRDEWLGSVDPAQIRTALRGELELPIERVLPAHGAPVLSGGRAALDVALA